MLIIWISFTPVYSHNCNVHPNFKLKSATIFTFFFFLQNSNDIRTMELCELKNVLEVSLNLIPLRLLYVLGHWNWINRKMKLKTFRDFFFFKFMSVLGLLKSDFNTQIFLIDQFQLLSFLSHYYIVFRESYQDNFFFYLFKKVFCLFYELSYLLLNNPGD